MWTVDHRIVEIALERVQGLDFERFIQAFFSAVMGEQYVPLGGVHDGGADGWFSGNLFQDTSKKRYVQASTTPDTKTKVRQTVRRLREYGRDPSTLTYCTSKTSGPIDVLEAELSDELECRITIRDAAYFTHHVNQSAQTVQAFTSYLAPTVSFLSEAGAASMMRENNTLPARTLCVFVGQELERRRGQTQLLEAVADSLIIWALEGTDPNRNIFLSRDDIEKSVIEAMPSAKTFFRGVLDARLLELKSKSLGGRRINYHSRMAGYCLPFDTRELIKLENVEDESLRIEVSRVFRVKASETIGGNDSDLGLIEEAVEICHAAIHKTFFRQGLELSLFLERADDDADLPSIESHIDEALREREIKGASAGLVSSAAQNILRQAFYKSTAEERRYFGKLSRTYILMFLLKNEPRIVEYLRSMSSNFILYVGTDILIRCLSEHMLMPEDRMMTNALKVLKAAGSQIVLTDRALDEVWHHLRNSHLEYLNNYFEIAQFMTTDLAKQIRKILIRAYFYYRFETQEGGKLPISWERYISQFCNVSELSRQSARDDLREYLVNEFSLVFEPSEVLDKSIGDEDCEGLAEKMLKARGKTGRDVDAEKILCRNAAATVLRVYHRRMENQERAGSNPYGYKTWWMTQQTKIRKATGELVAKQGAMYMMRPEFVLHFLAVMPTTSAVQKSFSNVFPSILGVRLGNRMDESAFRNVIEDARNVFDSMNESRARVVLSNATAKLQSDFFKKYDY